MDVSSGSSSPGMVQQLGTKLIFPATTDTYGRELYVVSSAPANIALSNSSIDENVASGTQVGTLSATDADAGDVISFSLPAGMGDNSLFSIVGNSLRTASPINFETRPSYSVTVRAADQLGLSSDRVLTITVNNLAELGGPIQLGSIPGNRSVIRQVVVDFDSDVIVDPGAFLMQKRTLVNNNVVLENVAATFALSTLPSGATRATLSFSGAQTYPGGALSDGYYQLTISGASVRLRATIDLLMAMATVYPAVTMCMVRRQPTNFLRCMAIRMAMD